MKRREFLAALGGAMAWPLAAHAQQPRKIPRVGVLWHAGNAEEEEVYLRVLTKAFNDLGYIEGKTIDLEHRFPAEQPERFRFFARELVESKVDAIIAVTALGAKEAKQASRTIPIVVVIEPDPIGDGLVESLARPGGNVTGLSLMAVDLSGKRLALMKEAVPNLSSVVLLVDPADPTPLDVPSRLTSTLRRFWVFPCKPSKLLPQFQLIKHLLHSVETGSTVSPWDLGRCFSMKGRVSALPRRTIKYRR
jgi:putative ABC transport system substrate-binding protein